LGRSIDLRGTPARYFEKLDKPTQKRIKKKLAELADEPYSAKHSKPLQGVDKRTARVGGYRIIFQVTEKILRVVDIGARGDIYKDL
jgi:mRNA interferase RelE/StbE